MMERRRSEECPEKAGNRMGISHQRCQIMGGALSVSQRIRSSRSTCYSKYLPIIYSVSFMVVAAIVNGSTGVGGWGRTSPCAA